MTDYREYAREQAIAQGIDPARFVAQIEWESGFQPTVVSGAGAVGIAQIVPSAHPSVDPTDPLQSLRYAAGLMAAYLKRMGSWPLALSCYNAGSGVTARYNWVVPYEQTQKYVRGLCGPRWSLEVGRVFDPTTSDELQQQDWTCSVRSATWLLRSIGVQIDAGAVQTLMVGADLVSSQDGLKDGSGGDLGLFFGHRFGLVWTSQADLSWREVRELAGKFPLMVGGRRWNHWVGVRGHDPLSDSLLIMNPAPGYKGVNGELDEADWSSLGPFAGVWLLDSREADMPRMRVAGTDGIGANLRAEPNVASAVLRTLGDGTEVEAGDYAWRPVSTSDGAVGWVAEDYLQPV